MSSFRLPDAVAVLIEQLQRSVAEFDSLSRKLENDVETQGVWPYEIGSPGAAVVHFFSYNLKSH